MKSRDLCEILIVGFDILLCPQDYILGVGECFGTLIRIPDVAMNSRVLSAVTAEPYCELLKISTTDYARITEVGNFWTDLDCGLVAP